MRDEWAVVRSCSYLHEAELLKSVLNAENIDAEIPDRYALGVEPAYSAFGGVRVMVHAADLARAEEVLAAGQNPE